MDDKLLAPDTQAFFSGITARYYDMWTKIRAPHWTGNPLFPDHLTQQDRAVAQSEYNAIPEFFYTNLHWLPVITPDYAEEFINVMSSIRNGLDVMLWSWCCGSSRLLYTMTGLPFSAMVLFPIDLRYGWDIGYAKHQRLLDKIDTAMKPFMTTLEPRCKYWSRAGTRRDPVLTQELRTAEKPMLRYVAKHAISLTKDQRHALAENPLSSAMWKESPLTCLNDTEPFRRNSRKTHMCAFSPEPDGRRSKKETMLRSSLPLAQCAQLCKCRYGHIHLKGYDQEKHQTRTAAAAL